MSVGLALHLLCVALVTGLATELGARLAPRLGWTDAPRPADADRKRQRRAVPAVGGAALLIGLACAPGLPWDVAWLEDHAFPTPHRAWLLATLAAVFVVGSADDRLALSAGKKTLAQLLALVPLALGVGWSEPAGQATWLGVGALLLGLVALNALNTFDNADGALGALCVVGFLFVLPFVAAACLGFLPFNLDARRPRNRASGAPTAYLGDAGAFVLGLLVLLAPHAWGVLVLPLLDLARLVLVRLAAGSRPWIGDRRHLAHRLQARGLTPLRVAAALAGIALPACLLLPRALGELDGKRAAIGLGTTAALFLFALLLTRAPLPCSSQDAPE